MSRWWLVVCSFTMVSLTMMGGCADSPSPPEPAPVSKNAKESPKTPPIQQPADEPKETNGEPKQDAPLVADAKPDEPEDNTPVFEGGPEKQ